MTSRILITGASSGIGRQLALDYASKGCHVYACGRSQQSLDSMAAVYPNRITPLVFDITDKQSVLNTLSPDAIQVDIVVLNAGTCEYVEIDDFNSDIFTRTFNTNVNGSMHCLEALLPKLAPQSQIVFISSSSAYIPLPRAAAYGGSKSAISYIAYSLATQLKGRQIDISVVHSGFVKTPLTDKNDFDMPMIVSAEQASKSIQLGIAKRKRDIHFPWLFTTLLKCLGVLPRFLQHKIGQKLDRNS